MTQDHGISTQIAAAAAAARREAYATAALAVGAICFVNLLGAEKGLMAILFGWLALKGAGPAEALGRARIGIGLALVQFATLGIVLVLFREQLAQLIALLRTLG